MKLSQRDKMLLTVLLIAAIWAIGVFFIIVPKFKDVKTARATYDTTLTTCNTRETTAKVNMSVKTKVLDEYKSGQEVASNFYYVMRNFEAEKVLMALLNDSSNKIDITSISISEPTTTEFTTYVPVEDTAGLTFVGSDIDDNTTDEGGDTAVNAQETVEQKSATAGCYSYSISYEAKKDAFLQFIDKLPTSNGKVSMLIDSVNISDVKSDVYKGSMSLNMYFINEIKEPTFAE